MVSEGIPSVMAKARIAGIEPFNLYTEFLEGL
jgi:hypothetical protein